MRVRFRFFFCMSAMKYSIAYPEPAGQMIIAAAMGSLNFFGPMRLLVKIVVFSISAVCYDFANYSFGK